MSPSVFALLDDAAASAAAPSSRLYTGFVREHRCTRPASLDADWAAVDADLGAGLHAVVLADYEWGARLLEAGHEQLAAADAGSLRVLMFDSLQHLSAEAASAWLAALEAQVTSRPEGPPAAAGVLELQASVEREAFTAAIHEIHAAIREGETYQVNYTYRLGFRSFGEPVSLYRRLRARQPVRYGAFIALPATDEAPRFVLSCSPELFLRKEGERLFARPMKGTASRATVAEGDSEIARLLAEDTKNRAENLMIVDLLRNDLGRIARTGSVRVPSLFEIEPYSTVFQMTSTIEAELPAERGFTDVLRALYPCGSITGAPKHRTMQIIAALETTPRGLYTGMIGWLDAPAPGQACGDFCLSVAIRTLVLNDADARGLRAGRLGIGAGIVIDSDARQEHDECVLKARFLTGLDPGFGLIETLYATRAQGARHFDRHLHRLQHSAAAFGFTLHRDAIVRAVAAQCAAFADEEPHRLRLTLYKDGSFDLVAAALPALPAEPVKLLLADGAVDAADPFLQHKTTLRARHDAALAAAASAGAFDVLFFNQAGELTEGARSNVLLQLDGVWHTPSLHAGVLPGVMRSVLLDDPDWQIRETRLTRADVERAQAIVVCNALRGVLRAQLAGTLAETTVSALPGP